MARDVTGISGAVLSHIQTPGMGFLLLLSQYALAPGPGGYYATPYAVPGGYAAALPPGFPVYPAPPGLAQHPAPYVGRGGGGSMHASSIPNGKRFSP
jgi:hypothetical protein